MFPRSFTAKFLLAVIIAIPVALVFVYFLKTPSGYVSHEISGVVTEVGERSFKVSGVLRVEGIEHREERIIEFSVNPETRFTKTTILAPKGTKPGESFIAETIKENGSLADLKPQSHSIRVVSDKNIFNNNKSTAVEVYYSYFKRAE